MALYALCLLALFALPLRGHAAPQPAVALYYGHELPLSELRAFDIAVIEPDHAFDDKRSLLPGTQFYAYVSVAEVQPSRPYHADIPAQWKFARNEHWSSDVVDQSAEGWPEFFASRVVAPLWQRGFRGFFLDTLDSYRLAQGIDEQAQQQGLVRVIETLHQRFPGIRLILNRGFEIVPAVRDKIQMVAAESLYRRWNAGARRYEEVPEADRQWLLGQLRAVQQQGLPALAIDYVPPHDRALTRETARRIRQDGFIPWVTDADVSTLGIGSIEPVARRVLILYNGGESPALNYANPHRYLEMPLNYMGYVADYADVREPLPARAYRDRYAGVVTWFSGYIPEPRRKDLTQWLLARMDEDMPLAVIGDLGMAPERALARRLGLEPVAYEPRLPLQQATVHPMMGLEIQPPAPGLQHDLVRLSQAAARQAQPLLALRDQRGQSLVGGAIMPWGGFVLDPNVLTEIPGTENARWIVDPFAFLRQSLQLPPIPVPDTTTENGRRLLLVHVDGDAFNTLAEFAGSPPSAEVLLKQVFEKYRVPTTMSIVEAEVAPDGLSPDLSPRLEAIARKMFQLPHVQIGSHTYSHPFLWDTTVQHGLFKDNPEAARNLSVPGYTMDLEREIVGSTAYINQRLAPAGKSVRILQWSGDTAPNARALEITARAGLLNINGGDTSISRLNPSLTAIGSLGIRKKGFLQVYAPITNENIYTNLWTGPFYGFERAIETFEMTGAPRRIKPVGIYYHVYSASKPASLKALYKVYDWALAQPLYTVHAGDFATKVQDFYDFAIARDDNGGWRLRGNGNLRTVRVPQALGTPSPGTSSGIAGWRPGPQEPYTHLVAGDALLRTSAAAPADAPARTPPYLFDANGRLQGWSVLEGGKRIEFALQAHMPLVFSLAYAADCQVRANGRVLKAQRPGGDAPAYVQQFELPDASAQIQLGCAAR